MQKSQRNNLGISENFKWEIKFSKTDLVHNEYCKRNVSRSEISEEISSKPDDNMDFEKLFRDISDNDFILFFGEPKIGKTMLAKKIAQDYFDSKRFDYIFFCNLNFRQPSREIFLFDLLVTVKDQLWMDDKEKYNPVLAELLQNSRILLILDEFNEMEFDTASESIPRVGVFNKDTPQTFLINILKKNILSNWKKIIVTRPFQLHRIYDSIEKILELKVLGFDYHSQAEMQSNQMLSLIFQNSNISNDLQSVSFLPYICQLLQPKAITCFEENITTTSLFAVLFLKFFECQTKQCKNKLKFKNLVDFCWSQFSYANPLRFCFDDDHLQNSSINDSYLNCFFTTIPGSSLFGFESLDYQFHFSNILIQEFLLALKIIFLPEDQFKYFFNALGDNEQFSMVKRFIFGFSSVHPETQLKLKKLGDFSSENFERNKNYLIKF